MSAKGEMKSNENTYWIIRMMVGGWWYIIWDDNDNDSYDVESDGHDW